MNKAKWCFLILLLTCGFSYANAQSGLAALKVYVHAGKVGESDESPQNIKVILQPVEIWSGGKKPVRAKSESNGYYSAEVSFGEYELIISADNYETYRAKVYLPSSIELMWGVRLHKLKKENSKPRNRKNSIL